MATDRALGALGVCVFVSCPRRKCEMDVALGGRGARSGAGRGPRVGGRGSHVYVETLAERAPQGPNPSPSRPSLGTGTGGDQGSAVDAQNGRHGARDALQAGRRHQQRPVEHPEVERRALSALRHAAAAAARCSAASSTLRSSVKVAPDVRARRFLMDLLTRRTHNEQCQLTAAHGASAAGRLRGVQGS